MTRSLSITIHPEPIKGEYLAVSDAMRQVLDFIEALEKSEVADGSDRQIVWRLTNAHTNSPPLTIVAEPYSVDPALSVVLEAQRVTALFVDGMTKLLRGKVPEWVSSEVGLPFKRVFERSLDGVGRTEIAIEGLENISITPQSAKVGLIALEQLDLANEASRTNWARTEYGAVEGQIDSLTHWNGKAALVIVERLSGQKVTCVLAPTLADKIGPLHKWDEAWEGKRVLANGALYYNSDNALKRVEVDDITDVVWSDVTVAQLRNVDLLGGRAVGDHLALIRGGNIG